MTYDDFKFKVKYEAEKVKEKTKSGLKKAWEFTCENKEMVFFLLPIAIGGAKKIAKVAGEAREANYYKTHTYDPVSHRWISHRPMTKYKTEIFAQRRNQGESVYDILNDLHLI